jgi:hypothetical protein
MINAHVWRVTSEAMPMQTMMARSTATTTTMVVVAGDARRQSARRPSAHWRRSPSLRPPARLLVGPYMQQFRCVVFGNDSIRNFRCRLVSIDEDELQLPRRAGQQYAIKATLVDETNSC